MRTSVMPVIHHASDALTLRNAEMAAEVGCEGVFLIQMQGLDHLVDAPAREVRRRFPSLKVGANRLRASAPEAIAHDAALGLDASWADDCGVTSRGVSALGGAAQAAAEGAALRVPGYRFFGSVAFKYQGHETDPPRAARLAADRGFVVVTSGTATGSAPDPAKLEAMRAAIPGHPFAVASGVTPDNAHLIAPHVDIILVATGISVDEHNFDPARLRALMAAVSGN